MTSASQIRPAGVVEKVGARRIDRDPGHVGRRAMRYMLQFRMINSFTHRGLEQFFLSGSVAGIQPKHKTKLRLQLAMLHAAEVVEDMAKPGWGLHPLEGRRRGIWAVKVSGNWRLTFRFENGNATILNYEDYH